MTQRPHQQHGEYDIGYEGPERRPHWRLHILHRIEGGHDDLDPPHGPKPQGVIPERISRLQCRGVIELQPLEEEAENGDAHGEQSCGGWQGNEEYHPQRKGYGITHVVKTAGGRLLRHGGQYRRGHRYHEDPQRQLEEAVGVV